jgi:hypothetical protein
MEDGFPWRLCEYSHGPVHVSTHLQILLNNQALSAAFSRLHRKDLDELVKSLIKSDFYKIIFQTFLYLFVFRKIDQQKTLFSQRKIWLDFQKLWKNLEKSYYLLIISNLVLKLLIAIYILFWIFIFQFHPLEFNFYINFGPYFYNCYLLFPYHFLIKIFYLLNLILILLIVTYFIWNNL